MRKRIIDRSPESPNPASENWLDLANLAQVEVTSEEVAQPIESALLAGTGSGWRAADSGEQVIRLVFDEPIPLHKIRLVFREESEARTQEYVLRWSADSGATYRDIVRQQYTFSPPGTTCEVEEYQVGIKGVTVLELRVTPNISGGEARASLAEFRLA